MWAESLTKASVNGRLQESNPWKGSISLDGFVMCLSNILNHLTERSIVMTRHNTASSLDASANGVMWWSIWKISEGKLHSPRIFFFSKKMSAGIWFQKMRKKKSAPPPEHLFCYMFSYFNPERGEYAVLSWDPVIWKVLYTYWKQVSGVRFLQEATEGGVATSRC